MKLTEHFTLEEFTCSETAKRLHIDNTASDKVIENLRNLCQQVLEPLRQAYGKPICISSGYRCPKLNKAVGGVQTSQHTKGEAADIKASPPALPPRGLLPKGKMQGCIAGSDRPKGLLPTGKMQSCIAGSDRPERLLFTYIRDNLPFDQLILEHNKQGTYWIHVSCKRDVSQNRRQVIDNLLKK